MISFFIQLYKNYIFQVFVQFFFGGTIEDNRKMIFQEFSKGCIIYLKSTK